jgi:hypothetical protein
LNEDSFNIQSAISDKASNFVHHIVTFVTGMWVACVVWEGIRVSRS